LSEGRGTSFFRTALRGRCESGVGLAPHNGVSPAQWGERHTYSNPNDNGKAGANRVEGTGDRARQSWTGEHRGPETRQREGGEGMTTGGKGSRAAAASVPYLLQKLQKDFLASPAVFSTDFWASADMSPTAL